MEEELVAIKFQVYEQRDIKYKLLGIIYMEVHINFKLKAMVGTGQDFFRIPGQKFKVPNPTSKKPK
jgi:hypothetical protein